MNMVFAAKYRLNLASAFVVFIFLGVSSTGSGRMIAETLAAKGHFVFAGARPYF